MKAEAGEPDPEWNKDPEGFDRTQWSKDYLDMPNLSKEGPAWPKLPPDWCQTRPTAFPDVTPVRPKELRGFVDKRVPPVLETDPPSRKLHKTKLRAATDELLFRCSLRYGVGDPKGRIEHTAAAMAQATREAVAAGLEWAYARRASSSFPRMLPVCRILSSLSPALLVATRRVFAYTTRSLVEMHRPTHWASA